MKCKWAEHQKRKLLHVLVYAEQMFSPLGTISVCIRPMQNAQIFPDAKKISNLQV